MNVVSQLAEMIFAKVEVELSKQNIRDCDSVDDDRKLEGFVAKSRKTK